MTQGFPNFLEVKIYEWMCKLSEVENLGLVSSGMYDGDFNSPAFDVFYFQSLQFIDDFEMSHRFLFDRYGYEYNGNIPPDVVDVSTVRNRMLNDIDLGLEFLNYLVQNVPKKQQQRLEEILQQTNHEYKVSGIGTKQVCLTKRVPAEVEQVAEEMLNKSDVLMSAWNSVYKKHKDKTEERKSYEHAVKECCRAIEEHISNAYNLQGTFGQLVMDLKNKTDKTFYKGESIDPNRMLFDTVKEFQNYRKQHTNHKTPTREDAEFILHTTIMFLYFIEK